MTDADDMVAWLTAQLDEDKRVANRLPADDPHESRLSELGVLIGDWDDHEDVITISRTRVLAEVAAKRKILADHTTRHTVEDGFCVEEGGPCSHAGEVDCAWHGSGPCSTVRALAEPYAGRPGWRPEWGTP